MGIDRIYHYFYKLFGGTECFEENSFKNSLHKIASDIIILDGNFILYNIVFELENDLNNIIKLILAIPHNNNLYREQIVKKIFYLIKNTKLKIIEKNITEIFEKENIEEMVVELSNLFNQKIKNNLYDKVLSYYYLKYIEEKVLSLHYLDFIKSFYIIFDGIPSMPKVMEQKRRKLKNFVESTIRKLNIEEYFKTMPNFLYQDDNGYYYDYNLYIKFKLSLSKSFGPTSNIFIYLEKYLKSTLENLTLVISTPEKFEEADYKIYNLINNLSNEKITIHCSDFDFIFSGLLASYHSNNEIYMIRHFKESFLYIYFPKLIPHMLSQLNLFLGSSLSDNIIPDLILITTLFGNDYLPELIELSFDNNFLDICKIFHEKFWIKNEIVYSKKINKSNLFIIFEELNKKSKRFYLENYLRLSFVNGNALVKVLPNEIETIEDLKLKILNPYWNGNISDELRDKLIPILINEEKPLGLKKKKKYPDFSINPFENLYNNQVFLSQNIISQKFKILTNKLIFLKNLDEIEEEKNYLETISKIPTNPEMIVNKYLQVLETYLSKFTDKNYLNKIHYNYYLAPKIEWIYKYFNKKDNEIGIVKNKNYFDNILHLIFISPHQNLEKTEDNWIINFIESNKEYFLILDKNKNISIDILIEEINKLNYRQMDVLGLIEKWKIYVTNINYQYYKSHLPLIETEFNTTLVTTFS